ncbi:MAG: phosphatidylglycerol lysyltransferase domain-containing protein [Syntrophobacteraceae bacterium]
MEKPFIHNPARLQFLEENGYPGPVSLATAFPKYFKRAFANEYGYWAYILHKSKASLFPDIVYFTGDPICRDDKLGEFIEAAVTALRTRGLIAALQVHKPAASVFETLKQGRFIAHQFGVETQVKLPYSLTGQVGTKLRHAVKNGLYVEELVWNEEADMNGEGISISIKMEETGTRKSKKSIPSNEFLLDSRHKKIIRPDSTELPEHCDSMIDLVNKIVGYTQDHELEEFQRKIVRFKEGKLPSGVVLFKENNGSPSTISAFGYYQPTQSGFNRYRFEIVKSMKTKSQSLLKPGKRLLTREDLDRIEEVSNQWLSIKLNPQEMGPPFLKPFSREYEAGRRLFVAKNKENEIVAFVDFDPVNWIDPDGRINRTKRGYYSNMIRNSVNDDNEGVAPYRNVRYLILGAAAQKFYSEGYSLINLGLNPFASISRNHGVSKKGSIYKGLSIIDLMLSWIAHNRFMNKTTFSYENVIRTKQRNWKDKDDVMTYLVFEGMLPTQLYSLTNTFIISGALGFHVVNNSIAFLKRRWNNRHV